MLTSPPAIERHSTMTATNPPPKPSRDLNDLLCTLNFDQYRTGPTDRTVPTGKDNIVKLNEQSNSTQNDQILRKSTTPNEISIDDDNLPDLVLPPQTPNRQEEPPPLNRSVVTRDPPSTETTENIDVNQTPNRKIIEENSQTSTTPRSVLTDLDAEELETAGALLQLGSPNLRDIDKEVNNELIMPVTRTRMEDFTKDMTETENRELGEQSDKQSEDLDSDKTVEYSQENEEPTTPKGTVRYKHYGIKRHSPSTSIRRRMKCLLCNAVLESKKQLNHHHRTEHLAVTCPDCGVSFPTPDTLQRRRYSHKSDHVFQCDICGKTCTFQSDLDRHKEKHNEETPWHCTENDCGRDFKHKAELVAHQVVHTGELFECEYAGCHYSNRDPRNVKRHYRKHTHEKKVKCKRCERKFTYYQQMKRHLQNDH